VDVELARAAGARFERLVRFGGDALLRELLLDLGRLLGLLLFGGVREGGDEQSADDGQER
jgi:hypothetical protein